MRAAALAWRGINYDAGTDYSGGGSSSAPWPDGVLRRHMAMIRDELHANSVTVCGTDIERPTVYGGLAAEAGPHVWSQPRLIEGDAAATPAHLAATADATEGLRRRHAAVDLSVGCELTMFTSGFIPGDTYGERTAARCGSGWTGRASTSSARTTTGRRTTPRTTTRTACGSPGPERRLRPRGTGTGRLPDGPARHLRGARRPGRVRLRVRHVGSVLPRPGRRLGHGQPRPAEVGRRRPGAEGVVPRAGPTVRRGLTAPAATDGDAGPGAGCHGARRGRGGRSAW